MTFADKVLQARNQLKMTQQKFAKELRVSFQTINRWENGKTEPQELVKEVFFAFCDKHGVKFE